MQNNQLQQENKQNQRIEYIDAMRGFTMLLVIFAHVETYTLGISPESTLISSAFLSFRMPLFFFISGFLSYKYCICICDVKTLIKESLNKVKIQLIPTIIIGLTYTYFVSNKNWYDFITNDMKMGYWFTISLMYMFLIFYMTCYITNKQSIKGNNKFCFILLIGTAICLYLALSPIRRIPILEKWCSITSFTHTCEYFIYFVTGVIMSRYKEKFLQAQNNQYISAIAIVSFIT